MKFDLGKICKTCGIDYAVQEDESFLVEIMSCFEKYVKCDWGDLCDEDKQANDVALINEGRILASYKTSKGKVYIITESDHSVTTVLFANEY